MGKIMINGEQYPSYVVGYTHPTTAGNKHIPAGGSSGQILRWASDGTAVWDDENTSSGSSSGSSGVTVQPTNLSFNTTNIKSGTAQYCVKNGFCTVVISNMYFAKTAPSGNIITTTLPKPLLNLSTLNYGAVMVMDCANNAGQEVTLAVNQSGQLVPHQSSGINVDYVYSGMITYPIA